jgi:hypothetical protein
MRLPGWERRLTTVMDAHEHEPFAWWRNDCARFAARCIEAMTGDCPLRGLTWPETAEGAREALAAQGGLEAYWTRALGQPKPSLRAQRGDLVLADNGGRLSCGIVTLDGWHVASPGLRGLARVELPSAVRAWSV